MSKLMPIYVESRMRVGMDELWRRTQAPEYHERWDLRFTEISYLPRPDPNEPQRFLYATRIGFGLRIEGAGETVGESRGPGERASALKFWSDDPKSLIRFGSGYWKYVQTDDGIRFLTRYDYETRFGSIGRWIDRLCFRPTLGWATAWSFDRLRLWIEKGIDPADCMERAAVYTSTRVILAAIWIYQGLVPKLLFTERSGELETIQVFGAPPGWDRAIILAAGAAEVLFGIAMLILWRARSLFLANIAGLLALTASVIPCRPEMFVWQFNPATLNLAMITLAAVGWFSARRELPSSRRCLRRPAGESP